MFLSDNAGICYTHLSGVFHRLNMLSVTLLQNFLCLYLTIEVAQIRAENGRFQKCITNKYLSLRKLKSIYIYKIIKEELRKDTEDRICKETITRPFIIRLVYGPRANKQFDI